MKTKATWVRCEDDMPGLLEVPVLVYTRRRTISIMALQRQRDGSIKWVQDTKGMLPTKPLGYVTHWTPLPKPPEET